MAVNQSRDANVLSLSIRRDYCFNSFTTYAKIVKKLNLSNRQDKGSALDGFPGLERLPVPSRSVSDRRRSPRILRVCVSPIIVTEANCPERLGGAAAVVMFAENATENLVVIWVDRGFDGPNLSASYSTTMYGKCRCDLSHRAGI